MTVRQINAEEKDEKRARKIVIDDIEKVEEILFFSFNSCQRQ